MGKKDGARRGAVSRKAVEEVEESEKDGSKQKENNPIIHRSL
jgi:hypothetical protein